MVKQKCISTGNVFPKRRTLRYVPELLNPGKEKTSAAA